MVLRFAEVSAAALTQSSPTLHEARAQNGNVQQTTDIIPPPRKVSKLFANYRVNTSTRPTESSVADDLNKYITEENVKDNDIDCVSFWKDNRSKYSKLMPAVWRTIPVPASSAPVERVFSYGGIFFRPNRARMSDKLLSTLVFLKCNECCS